MIYTIVKKGLEDNIDAVISFDSITSMEESWSSTVTSQVVEYGFNVTDNINIEAPTYTISAIISSYSLFNTDSEIVWNEGQFLTSGVAVDKYSHVKARDKIIEIFEGRSIVTLIESELDSDNKSDKQKYSDLKMGYHKETEFCVITSLTISHPSEGYGAFMVSMTIQKINRANLAITDLAEGEKRPMLRPLSAVYEKTTSSQKLETGDVDPTTGMPVEKEAADTTTKGNHAEKNKQYREELGMDKSEGYLEALAKAEYETGRTGEAHSVVPRGDTLVVIKGFNKNALMTVGGIVE